MVTIIIGVSESYDYKMGGVSVDIPPFPEWNSGHYIEIPGEGIVFTGEKMMTANGVTLVSSNLITAPMTGRLFFLSTKTG
ncbi:Uncharacterised protein [Escherichia coli]|nr:Uncharacterised protein [Escherichia coli]